MKLFTLRLFQFAFCALLVTILFRYILNICIVQNGWILPVLCSIVYFGSMFLCGLYFGRKDEIENGIHDIGFRFHITTYIMCIGISFLSFYIGWETETLKSIAITALCWGGILFLVFQFLVPKSLKYLKIKLKSVAYVNIYRYIYTR